MPCDRSRPGGRGRHRPRTAWPRCASASRPTRPREWAPAMPDDHPLRVAGVAGSLRRASFNRGLLRAAVESAPEGMTIEPLEIRELPHYDADLDVEGGPEVVRAF